MIVDHSKSLVQLMKVEWMKHLECIYCFYILVLSIHFKIHLRNRSSADVLLALAISPRSPAPFSARCDTVKTFPTKALPLRYLPKRSHLGRGRHSIVDRCRDRET